MWLCTTLGFFSIVRKEPELFHIRARCREDLEQLALDAGTGTPFASYAGSDYPWRIRCQADVFNTLIFKKSGIQSRGGQVAGLRSGRRRA